MTDLLGKISGNAIVRAADKFGFRNRAVVEQLFVDFAACEHTAVRLPCTIFGGMCMHLHARGSAQRLSRDVDIMTTASAGEVDDAVHDVFGPMRDCQVREAKPRRPHPIKNLQTYHIKYDSRLGGQGEIKMDFLCEFRSGLTTEEIDRPQVLGVSWPLKVQALAKEALLADKLTTLALGGIGLPKWRLHDAPKQVYDIAALVRMGGAKELSNALSSLPAAVESRISLQEEGGDITAQNTIGAIQRAVEGFVNFESAAVMSGTYKSHLENFRDQYLQNGGESYKKHERVSDLFTVVLLSAAAGKAIAGATTASESAGTVATAMEEAQRLTMAAGTDTRTTQRRALLNTLSDKGVTKDFLASLTPDQMILLEAAYVDG